MDAVAHALADPIRRDILRMVQAREVAAGAIAGAFSVSRPAVSRHLRVLREAGLVRDTLRGRERTYRLVPSALDEFEAFVRELRTKASESPGADTTSRHEGRTEGVDWGRRLAALETEVHRVRRQRRTATPSGTRARQTNRKETA